MLSLSQQNHSNSTTTTNDSIFFDASDLFTKKMSTLTAQWFPLFQKSFALVKVRSCEEECDELPT